jgi:hypothetical protein
MGSPYSRDLTKPHERTIRVLQLKPPRNTNEKVPAYTFVETSLDNPLPYTALSYQWGKDKRHVPINVDDGNVLVTANGDAALTQLRKTNGVNYLWIDAICINQDNIDEKGFQVAMMDQVYSKAESVIIWLGEACDDSDGALEWCKQASRLGNVHVIAKIPYRPNMLHKRTRRQVVETLWEWGCVCTNSALRRVKYQSTS